MIAFRGNQKANNMAGVLGLYWYARRTTQRAIETLSRIGLSTSYQSIHAGFQQLRKDALKRARDVAANMDQKPWMPTHDNLQFKLNVGQATLTNHSSFLHTTTAYITPMWNTDSETMKCDPLLNPDRGQNGILSANDVMLTADETTQMDRIFAYHVMSVLIEMTTGAAHDYFVPMRAELRKRMPEVHKIKLHKTEIFPLSSMPLNEASKRGNRKVLESIFQEQLRIPKDKVWQFPI